MATTGVIPYFQRHKSEWWRFTRRMVGVFEPRMEDEALPLGNTTGDPKNQSCRSKTKPRFLGWHSVGIDCFNMLYDIMIDDDRWV
jgi:hypothetical protein